MKTIIECGANNGNDTQWLLEQYQDSIIYAIEPTHELLIKHLWPKFSNNDRVKVIPFAIDIENSFKKFNINQLGHDVGGCSSLYEFNEIDPIWGNRTDFYFTHSYLVPTITLYDLCELYNIQQIDYLWIDTQGNDFNCLLSLKDKINNVISGKCEVGYNTDLYKANMNNIKYVKPWLEEHGFHVSVNPDVCRAECDLIFNKKY